MKSTINQLQFGFVLCWLLLLSSPLLGQNDTRLIHGYVISEYVEGPPGWLFVEAGPGIVDSIPCGTHRLYQLGSVPPEASGVKGTFSPFGHELVPVVLEVDAAHWAAANQDAAFRQRTNFCNGQKNVGWNSYFVNESVQLKRTVSVVDDHLVIRIERK